MLHNQVGSTGNKEGKILKFLEYILQKNYNSLGLSKEISEEDETVTPRFCMKK